MFDKDLFSQKLVYLRQSHQLSIPQEAALLGLTRPSLDQLEAGKILPQFSTLNNLADLYAVSADWLLERGVRPFNRDVLFRLEVELWIDEPKYAQSYYVLRDSIRHKCADFSHYWKVANREALYSEAARSNIIFACQILIFFAKNIETAKKNLNLLEKDFSIQEFLENEETCWQEWLLTLYGVQSKRLASSWMQLYRKCYSLLTDYLLKDKNGQFKFSPQDDIFAPVYDV